MHQYLIRNTDHHRVVYIKLSNIHPHAVIQTSMVMDSTKKNSIVEEVLKITLQYIDKHDEADFNKIQKDSRKMDELDKVMRDAAEEDGTDTRYR